jgi:hypothetical protein
MLPKATAGTSEPRLALCCATSAPSTPSELTRASAGATTGMSSSPASVRARASSKVLLRVSSTQGTPSLLGSLIPSKAEKTVAGSRYWPTTDDISAVMDPGSPSAPQIPCTRTPPAASAERPVTTAGAATTRSRTCRTPRSWTASTTRSVWR